MVQAKHSTTARHCWASRQWHPAMDWKRMMWFEELTGFVEESPEQVRANITVDGNWLTSNVNGRRLCCGNLETPSLVELRRDRRRL